MKVKKSEKKDRDSNTRTSITIFFDVLVWIGIIAAIALTGMILSYLGGQTIGVWLGVVTICLCVPLALSIRLVEITLTPLIKESAEKDEALVLNLSSLPARFWIFFFVVSIGLALWSLILGIIAIF